MIRKIVMYLFGARCAYCHKRSGNMYCSVVCEERAAVRQESEAR